MEVAETYLMAGLIGPDYNHPDRIAMDVLSEILSGGVYPLLYIAFSSQPNLISSARLHYLTHAQTGLMVITITTREKNARTTKRLLQKFFSVLPEINYSRDEYLSRTEIGAFDFLLGSQNRFQWSSQKMMEDPLLVAMALGKHLLLGDESQQKNYLEAISSLSPTELRKVARKYFVGGEPVWVVIKPE
jgi:predicted Zn-dependent peptidase